MSWETTILVTRFLSRVERMSSSIDAAVTAAKAAPKPGPDDLLTDVYVKY